MKEIQVDHLVLLVGTNPLPNYVAAKLLTKDSATLHFAYTQGTKQIAEALKKVLCREKDKFAESKVKLWLLEDGRDSTYIFECANRIIGTLTGGSIGLHYTGGTKAMAVHMHCAFLACKRNVIFTYLDGDNLSIRVDARDGKPARAIPIDDAVPIKIDQMMEMHGRELGSKSNNIATVKMQSTAEKLLELYSNGGNDKETWRKQCSALVQGDGDKLKGAKFPSNEPFTTILSDLNDGDMKSIVQMAREQGWKVKEFCGWLDGKWLEHVVLQKVQSLASKCCLGQVIHSLSDITRPIDFEFDVATLRGHQLFALTITTSQDRKACKLKLFEAYVRARQLGGDEARVALVCAHEDEKSLEQEINADWDTHGRVRVFGKDSLLHLNDELKQWFNRNT